MTWPRPLSDSEGDRIWVEMYEGSRLRKRDVWFSEARKRLDWMSMFVNDGFLLEIGSGTGEFVASAASDGFQAEGIEPSRWAVRKALEIGAQVKHGYLSDWVSSNPGLKPDVVCLWHVLEHLPSPLDVLQLLATISAQDGFVFGEVPNFDSSEASRLGAAWGGAQPLEHHWQFTLKGLEILFRRAGFRSFEGTEISRRIYTSLSRWRQEEHRALIEGYPWPPLDLIRFVAKP